MVGSGSLVVILSDQVEMEQLLGVVNIVAYRHCTIIFYGCLTVQFKSVICFRCGF